MLAELEVQNRKEAHRDFVAAMWEGAEPSRLLSLARAAGMSGDGADALIARVAQAKEQVTLAKRLPRLRKDAAGATGRLQKIQARANAEIARLESEVRDAAFEVEAAQRAVNEADSASRQLLLMHDEGLLPGTEAPEEILYLVDRRDAEERFRQADSARIAADNERDRVRKAVRGIEERLATMPISNTSEYEESHLKDRLKEARRQLAEAESNLKKAEAAADSARKAIP
jgi:hypothetical protein